MNVSISEIQIKVLDKISGLCRLLDSVADIDDVGITAHSWRGVLFMSNFIAMLTKNCRPSDLLISGFSLQGNISWCC